MLLRGISYAIKSVAINSNFKIFAGGKLPDPQIKLASLAPGPPPTPLQYDICCSIDSILAIISSDKYDLHKILRIFGTTRLEAKFNLVFILAADC